MIRVRTQRSWRDSGRTRRAWSTRQAGIPDCRRCSRPRRKLPGWRQSFFYRFFDALRAQGNESVLYFSWASIHNYTINHPPTYPYDEVNLTGRPLNEAEIQRYGLTVAQVEAIDQARSAAREPGGFFLGDNLADDSTCFLQFVAYHDQFHDLFGFDIPLISTEGGARRGSAEDPRYPTVDGQTVSEWTLWSADYMLDDAPPYYFATCTWLLAQRALDYTAAPWENDAWYHDRTGGQEPVVPALKARPRRTEVRRICFDDTLDDAVCRAEVRPPFDVLPLAAYPRPQRDNGRGVHWAPTNQPESREIVDYFVGEVAAMNLRWVKLLQDDQAEVTHAYLLEQLRVRGIEPILRVYKPLNDPYQHLGELVPRAEQLGVHYFELFSEPNVAGSAGGWRSDEPISDGRLVELWLPAARQVRAAGGYPSLPPLSPGGTVDDMLFLRRFLEGVRARAQVELLTGSWIPLHNYFLNHPLDYPADPVNVNDVLLTPEEIAARGLTSAQVAAIDGARKIAKRPRSEGGFWVGNTVDEDSNGFRKFEAYEHIFRGRFGFDVPIIGTEGGAIEGSAEDPRYPPVTDSDVASLTVAAYRVMLDDAPTYFFAQTAWLLANHAGGHSDERFEHAAWYKDRVGTVLPVVTALKSDPRRWETREPSR